MNIRRPPVPVVLLACLLALGALIYVLCSPTRADRATEALLSSPIPVLMPEDRHEDINQKIYALLQKGDYQAAETAFNNLNANGNLNRNGFDRLDACIDNMVGQHPIQITLKMADEWARVKPKSAYAHAFKGAAYLKAAYRARSTRFASEVGPIQWRNMNEITPVAREALQKSLSLQPNLPAYGDLIDLEKLVGHELGAAKSVYDNASRAFPGAVTLDYTYSEALKPKWHGSMPAYLDFIKSRLEQDNSQSALLSLRIHNFYTLSERAKDWKAYLREPRRWQEAQNTFLTLIDRFPKSTTWLLDYADYAYDIGYCDLALRLSNRAISIKPDQPNFYSQRSKAHACLDNRSEAIDDMVEVTNLNPDNLHALSEAAAMSLFDPAKLKPETASLARAALKRNVLGDVSADAGRLYHFCISKYAFDQDDAAIASCDRAISIDNRIAGPHYVKTFFYRNKGNQEAADEEYKIYRQLGGTW